jgi:sterol 14-demethylase
MPNTVEDVVPMPPRVSGALPLVGHTVEYARTPYRLLRRGLREHGKVFSILLAGRPAVILIGSGHSHFFFTESGTLLSIQRAYSFLVSMFGPDFLITADDAEYKRQRDVVLPRFQGRQLDSYVTVMDTQVKGLISRLGDSGEFDLVPTVGPLVVRISTHSFLGTDLGWPPEEFYRDLDVFSSGIDPVLPSWVPAPHLIRSRHTRDRLRARISRLLALRRRDPVNPPDFLQALTDARYPDGSPVPDRILVNMVLMFVWTAQETTTGHLSWALIDLLRHPEQLERILAEQRAVVEPGAGLTLGTVRKLTHLERAVRESERLHPIPFTLMRIATQTFDYAGYRIPEGCMVMVSPPISHRLEEFFDHPDRYDPDRFERDPKSVRHLIGFGGGPHRCLGAQFAVLEMKVVLTRLLEEYSLELHDTDPRPVRGPLKQWPAGPCRIRYRRKTRAANAGYRAAGSTGNVAVTPTPSNQGVDGGTCPYSEPRPEYTGPGAVADEKPQP